jgi:hypothetical protein
MVTGPPANEYQAFLTAHDECGKSLMPAARGAGNHNEQKENERKTGVIFTG